MKPAFPWILGLAAIAAGALWTADRSGPLPAGADGARPAWTCTAPAPGPAAPRAGHLDCPCSCCPVPGLAAPPVAPALAIAGRTRPEATAPPPALGRAPPLPVPILPA